MHGVAVARGAVKRRILAIRFDFLRQHKTEGIPHGHTCTLARTSHLSNLFDYFASSFFKGEHFSLSRATKYPRHHNHGRQSFSLQLFTALYSSLQLFTALYSHFDKRVPAGTIVASRSGPVEIIPISTCRKSEINRK